MFCLLEECLTLCSRGSPYKKFQRLRCFQDSPKKCLTLCSRGSRFKFSEMKQHDTSVAFGIFFVKKKMKLCIVSVCLISIIAFFKVFNITYGVNLSTNTWKIYSIVVHIVLNPYTVQSIFIQHLVE